MKTDPRPKKKIGTGGVCSVLKKFLHPYNLVRNHEVWKRIEMDERVEDLLVVGYEERESGRRSNRQKKASVLFRHNDFPNQELYCVNHRYVHCYRDGGQEFHFNLGSSAANASSANRGEQTNDNPTEDTVRGDDVNETVNLLTTTTAANARDLSDDVQRIRAMGYKVDDDNEPAPENVPHHDIAGAQGDPTNAQRAAHPSGLISEHKQQWGHHPIDQRRVNVHQNVQPSVPGIPSQMPITTETSKSFIFLLFFGRCIVDSLIIPATNESLREDDLKETTMGEFLR